MLKLTKNGEFYYSNNIDTIILDLHKSYFYFLWGINNYPYSITDCAYFDIEIDKRNFTFCFTFYWFKLFITNSKFYFKLGKHEVERQF